MCEYPKTPKRVRIRERAVMDMTPASASVLRTHAFAYNVLIRDAAQDMARLLENRDFQLLEASNMLGEAQAKLSASEEERRLALEQRDKWQREYLNYHSMTAWDHVQAAFRKRPVVGTLILGAAAWCIGTAGAVGHIIVRGM